jgi:hypothetical protein
MANDDRHGWWRRRDGDGSRRRSCLDDQMPVLLIKSLRAIGRSGYRATCGMQDRPQASPARCGDKRARDLAAEHHVNFHAPAVGE